MASRGRPSKKTPELCAEIVERIAKGEPLAAICRDEHMPSVMAVWRWEEDDADFSLAIARARDAGADAIAADALAIADDASGDTKKTERGDEVLDGEWVARSRLRVETRLKLLAKWNPKRYGEKVAVDHGGEVAHKHSLNMNALTAEQLRALASIPIEEKN